jgi:poly-gamma-glutamate synthesis protein (capsule biosynthesis protein)
VWDERAPAIWFGGDVHMGAAPRGGLTFIRDMVGGAVGVVNLEGPIVAEVGGAWADGGVRLANPPGAAAVLARDGVVAASIANNHRLDDGAAGEARTVASLRAAGVAAVGASGGDALLYVGDSVVRIQAFELTDSPLRLTLPSQPGVDVVALHVTGPPSYLPTPALVSAVDAAVAAGAEIVVAHGTHVVGPVERRGGALVAWGLGNLLFDCPCTDADEAIVLRVTLTEGLPAAVLPIRAGLGGAAAGPAPDPDGLLDLLDALGGARLRRVGAVGWL